MVGVPDNSLFYIVAKGRAGQAIAEMLVISVSGQEKRDGNVCGICLQVNVHTLVLHMQFLVLPHGNRIAFKGNGSFAKVH